MGKLTETEIFDQMRSSLKAAIQHCEDLAVEPVKGFTYEFLRNELKLIEGCCRQASAWREDTRWLNAGLAMGEAHKLAGGWLRGYKVDGERIALADKHSYWCFKKLADNLRNYAKLTEQIRTKRTGRRGMILPTALPAPFRETRQHRVVLPTVTPGGIIVPEGARLH